MVKFATIILAAGEKPQLYPRISELEIKMMDHKERLLNTENLSFHQPMFVHRSDMAEKFRIFLSYAEQNNLKITSSKLSDTILVLYIDGTTPKVFLRC